MEELLRGLTTYVERTAGRTVMWRGPVRTPLPAYLERRYDAHWLEVADQRWLAVVLKSSEPAPPLAVVTQLEKLAERLGTTWDRTCLAAEQLPAYMRRRLVELGQTFVIPGRQLFWPALGSAETVQRTRRLKPEPVPHLSPVAQLLFFAILLKRLPTPNTVTESSIFLQYTSMSVSRAVKELEASGLIMTAATGRMRSFALSDSPKASWERAGPLLRSPVLREFYVRDSTREKIWLTLAGETALAEFSNLSAPATRVFAVSSRTWSEKFEAIDELPLQDAGCCQVQLWRYAPDTLARDGVADPLSLHLSLRESKDMRVQIALEEMMEQFPW
jgi:hypothetical protein